MNLNKKFGTLKKTAQTIELDTKRFQKTCLTGSTYPHRPGIFALYISQTPSGTDQIDYHFLKMLLSIDHLQKEQKYPIYVTGKALLAKTTIHNEQK